MAVENWFALGGLIAIIIVIATGISNWFGYKAGMKDSKEVYEGSWQRGWDEGSAYWKDICLSKTGKDFDRGWEGMGRTVIQLMETAEDLQLDGNDEGLAYNPNARDWQAIKNGLKKALAEKKEGK